MPALPSVAAGWDQYQFSQSHELIASFPAHYRHQVAREGRQSLSLTYSIIRQGVNRSPMEICCTGLPVPLKLGSVLLHFPRIGVGPTFLSATAGEQHDQRSHTCGPRTNFFHLQKVPRGEEQAGFIIFAHATSLQILELALALLHI